MTQFDRFVGIDVGKYECHAYFLWNNDYFIFPNDAKGHHALLAKLKPYPDSIIAMEPTGGYEYKLWAFLDSHGFDSRQIHAAKIRHFAFSQNQRAKTDKIDARMIASYIAYFPQAGRHICEQSGRQLIALVTKRKQLVDMRKSLLCQRKQRCHDVEDMALFDDELQTLLEHQIATLNKRIEALIAADEILKRKAEILRSIKGIGPVVTSELLSQMPELGRVSDKQIASLAGLAPFTKASGTWKGQSRIWGGRSSVRRMLYLAAIVAIRYNNVLGAFALRLKEKGKKYKVIVTAVARKLIVIANAIIRKDQICNSA